jgi:hypothetical protein
MKKNITLFSLLAIAFLTVAQPLQAITIRIDSQGTIRVYEQVLGEQDAVLPDSNTVGRPEKKPTQPENVIRNERNTDTSIRLKPSTPAKTEVEIKRIPKKSGENTRERVIEQRNEDDVNVEFSAEAREVRDQRKREENEKRRIQENESLSRENREILVRELEDRSEVERQELMEVSELRQRQAERELQQLETSERVRENTATQPRPEQNASPRRRQLQEELQKVRLSDEQTATARQFVLESSDGAKMKFSNAEVQVNTEAGTLTVTTPSGNTVEINTLPDEVLEKIQARQLTPSSYREVNVEVSEDGTVSYVMENASQTRRVFGLFERRVPGKAVVNDQTGEVEFTAQPSSLLDRFLSPFMR